MGGAEYFAKYALQSGLMSTFVFPPPDFHGPHVYAAQSGEYLQGIQRTAAWHGQWGYPAAKVIQDLYCIADSAQAH